MAQAVFASELGRNLLKYAPTAPENLVRNNPLAIYDLPAAIIPNAIEAYTNSLNAVLILIVPAAGIALISCFFVRFEIAMIADGR